MQTVSALDSIEQTLVTVMPLRNKGAGRRNGELFNGEIYGWDRELPT